jgi:hypothetical protein
VSIWSGGRSSALPEISSLLPQKILAPHPVVLSFMIGDAQYYYRYSSTKHKAIVVLSFLYKFVNIYIDNCIIFILIKYIAIIS